MAFIQDPPELGYQYDEDALVREYVARRLPPDELATVEAGSRDLGEPAAGALSAAQPSDRLNHHVPPRRGPGGRG